MSFMLPGNVPPDEGGPSRTTSASVRPQGERRGGVTCTGAGAGPGLTSAPPKTPSTRRPRRGGFAPCGGPCRCAASYSTACMSVCAACTATSTLCEANPHTLTAAMTMPATQRAPRRGCRCSTRAQTRSGLPLRQVADARASPHRLSPPPHPHRCSRALPAADTPRPASVERCRYVRSAAKDAVDADKANLCQEAGLAVVNSSHASRFCERQIRNVRAVEN